MGKAARQVVNRKRKQVKAEIKSDVQKFKDEAIPVDIEKLNDDEFYAMELKDGTMLFDGQWLPGNFWKGMLNDKETK